MDYVRVAFDALDVETLPARSNCLWHRCFACVDLRSLAFQFFLAAVSGVFKVFSQKRVQQRRFLWKRISEPIVEQFVDISLGGGFGQGSASSAGAADENFTGFSHFSTSSEKSAKLGSRTRV